MDLNVVFVVAYYYIWISVFLIKNKYDKAMIKNGESTLLNHRNWIPVVHKARW